MKTKLYILTFLISFISIAQNKTTKTIKSNKSNFTTELTKSVGENFNIKMARNLGLPVGKVRIMVSMRVDSLGNFKAKAKAPHIKLEEEAVRVVTNFYNLNKDNYNAKEINSCYSLPIQFMIEKKE